MVSRRWTVAFVIVILVITVGVELGLDSITPDQESQYDLHVTQANGNVSSDEIVQFEELTPGQQRVFKDALLQGNTDVPDTVSVQLWIDNRYVRYQDRTYRTAVSTA